MDIHIMYTFLVNKYLFNLFWYHSGSSTTSLNSEHNSHINSDCDCDSESSWVITPAPTFRESSQSNDIFHPMEDLLIEHPTMSVYHHARTTGGVSNSNEQLTNINHASEDGAQGETPTGRGGHENQNRELVLLQNRLRHQVAVQMAIPLVPVRQQSPRTLLPYKPPKLTRKALKRHNTNSCGQKGKQSYRVQKCWFKAGRRRC